MFGVLVVCASHQPDNERMKQRHRVKLREEERLVPSAAAFADVATEDSNLDAFFFVRRGLVEHLKYTFSQNQDAKQE